MAYSLSPQTRVADSSSNKRSQLVVGTHDETLSVAVSVNDPDRSPFGIDGSHTALTPIGFAKIVGDYFPNASSCRAYADEEFSPETLQRQAFRLHYLTFALQGTQVAHPLMPELV